MMRFTTTFSILLVCSLVTLTRAQCPNTINFIIGSFTNLISTANGTGVVLANLKQKGPSVISKMLPALVGENPSYLTRSGQYLYAVNENYNPSGSLTQVHFRNRAPYISSITLPVGDTGPTHVAVVSNLRASAYVRRIILVANYGGGSVTSFAKTTNLLFRADRFVVPKNLASRTTSQQSSPHPHMVLPFKGSLVVPDLGSDIVWYLWLNRKNAKIGALTRVKMARGDGPRHAAKHPLSDTVYVVNEISLTVAVLRPNCGGNKLLGLCYKKQLIDNMGAAKGASAAAIRTSSNGKFLYASVRYPGTKEGKIVGFRVNKRGDIIRKLGEFPSGGIHPRDFMIVELVKFGGLCRTYLAVVNRDSNNLVLIRRNFATGSLFPGAINRYGVRVETPTSIIV